MSLLGALLASVAALAAVFFTIPCMAANLRFYRRDAKRRGASAAPELTVIKPLKGADADLRANLQTFADFRPAFPYQIILALESEDDPAFAAVADFKGSNPEVDISVVISGPSGKRMGKMHNMIAAYREAKYANIAFSDGDLRMRDETAERAVEALVRVKAAFFPPYYPHARDILSTLVVHPFNYYYLFCLPWLHYARLLDFCGGGFMVLRRSAIEEIGGLEKFAYTSADDYSLGHELFMRGSRIELVPQSLEMTSFRRPLGECLANIRRMNVMIHAILRKRYWLILALNPVLNSFLSAILSQAAPPPFPAAALLLFSACCALRIAAAAQLDHLTQGRLAPLWNYPILLIADVVMLFPSLLPFFTDTFSWRGKTYRVRPGGEVAVVA